MVRTSVRTNISNLLDVVHLMNKVFYNLEAIGFSSTKVLSYSCY